MQLIELGNRPGFLFLGRRILPGDLVVYIKFAFLPFEASPRPIYKVLIEISYIHLFAYVYSLGTHMLLIDICLCII